MNERVNRWPYAVVAAIALAVIGAAVYRIASRDDGAPPADATEAGTEAGAVALADASRTLAGIGVEPVRVVRRATRFEAPGVLAVNEKRTARLGSMVEGVVVRTMADVGDRVGRGQALAELHSPVVHVAWADYRKAAAERRRAETDLQFADDALARARRLLADKAISAQELARAEVDRVAAAEALEMARTELRRSEEALEHYGVTNAEDPSGESGESIPVRSPLGGVVLERTITEGSAVTPGQQVYVVSDLSSLWAIAEVAEAQLPILAPGRPVSVRVAAYPGETFAGTITFVGDVINPKSRRVTVRCEVPNPGGRLKPEMYASLSLGTGEPHEALVVPAAAIQELTGRPLVFVQDDKGVFHRRDVVLGPDEEGLVEIREGLRAGEPVATTGSFLLKSELLKGALAED
jgi:cobalt-zinc-cadmium efflux system membrane fusion protein